MTVDSVSQRLDQYLAVDVREEHEFAGPLGHIADAELYSLGSIPNSLLDLDRGRRLLLVCRSGGRSRKACEMLADQGFQDLTNLEGGMIAWNQASLPVQRPGFETLHDLVANAESYFAQVTPANRDAVRDSMTRLLDEAGSSYEAPSVSAVEWSLDELAKAARDPNPPADLDLVVEAYRRDLAVL
jgi:rhodanese-related sulfurtransferase